MRKKDTFRHIKAAIIFLTGVIVFGTIGYIVIEKWNFIDSFYMTIISITTTGFEEVHPLSHTGKIFTILIIVFGISAIAYTAGRATQYFIEEYFFRSRRMMEKIRKLKDHYIVCGFGRMGKQICKELKNNGASFVVIESNPEQQETLKESGYLYIEGDATNDETLIESGVKRAKGLVSVVEKDADNIFVTLTARDLNRNLFIVTRAINEGSERKLIKAGANRVIKPYELGGHRMVQMLLRPYVVDFIDIVGKRGVYNLAMEEIQVEDGSILVGSKIAETPIRRELNIIVIAIYTKEGKFIYNPGPNVIIQSNDTLIVIGEENNINKLKNIARG
ncbi:MAG: potassium channel protein [Candidatus Marinimicrobia bacterium]|nr:potassium channel protein [Candidatus Neomarinimicrobiota bacterium]